MAGMKYSLIEFFPPYRPDFYSLRTLLACLSCVKQSLSTLPCCCLQLLMIPLIMSVLYVWAQFNKDTIVTFWFGTRFKVSRILVTGPPAHCVPAGWWMMVEKQCKAQPWVELCHTVVLMTIWCLLLCLPGTLSTLGHPDFQLHHWRLVSIDMICSAVTTCLWIKII